MLQEIKNTKQQLDQNYKELNFSVPIKKKERSKNAQIAI